MSSGGAATRPFLVAGDARQGEGSFDVRNPWDGSVVASVGVPGDADVEEAVASAAAAFEETRRLPLHVRADALMHVSRRIAERADELAMLITQEGGKPLKWSRIEVARATATFRWAAEEVRRSAGEVRRLDTDAGSVGRTGIVRRFPVGPVLAIAPFNFPLNLVAHKVAPALGVGAPVVVKPATQTPLSALVIGELVGECGLPSGTISVLPLTGERTEPLVRDPRLPKVSFTGSTDVGWRIRGLAPRKRFTLELGGNAGVIVAEDADLDHAAARCAFGGYYQAGQSCISVQRIVVAEPVHDAFLDRFVAAVRSLEVGDPARASTDVGPLIDAGALDRVAAWVDEAVAAGADVVVGGKREDPCYLPTILADTMPDMKVRCEEVFAPVTTVSSYGTFEDALAQLNDSRYGLQAGVFTGSLERAFLAHRELEVGGVVIGDVPSFRADQMPYGGVKDSGTGREGLRYAMEEMTESRILVLSGMPL